MMTQKRAIRFLCLLLIVLRYPVGENSWLQPKQDQTSRVGAQHNKRHIAPSLAIIYHSTIVSLSVLLLPLLLSVEHP